jgi:hypothetical protein
LRKPRGTNGSAKAAARTRAPKPWRPIRKSSGRTLEGAPSRELAKYLQDHFAGARAGIELARSLAERNQNGELGRVLRPFVEEIELDRALLKQVMEVLEVEFGPVKQATAWLGGKFLRMRPSAARYNGSALTRLLELESLSLGVEGKALLWQALIELRERIPKLLAVELEPALIRARVQRDLLETLRLQAARALAAT